MKHLLLHLKCHYEWCLHTKNQDKGLSSLTYNIEDVNALKELKGSLEILWKFTAFQKIDEKENSAQSPINKQSGKKQLETSFGNYLPLPVRPKKKRFHNRAGEFASMMQKHYRVQIPVDGVSAKTSKTKSTLKRKKEPHNKPKHPSLPKKQRTEEPSYLIENEKKTCIDPTAAQKRNNTTGPKISTCHDNNKNEEIMHATCVTNNQHLNSEGQPSAQEHRWTSPSKLQSVLKQSSKFKEEHLSNSQVLTVNNAQSATVNNDLSSTVRNGQSATVNTAQSATVNNDLSSTVCNGQSVTVNTAQSATVNNDLSSNVCNGQSATVNTAQSATVNNDLSSTVRNGQSATVNTAQSATVNNDQSSTVCNAQSATVNNVNSQQLSTMVSQKQSTMICHQLSAVVS